MRRCSMPYTVFKEQVAAGNVAEIYAQGATVEGQFVVAGDLSAAGYGPSLRRGAERRAERAAHVDGIHDDGAGVRRSRSRGAA